MTDKSRDSVIQELTRLDMGLGRSRRKDGETDQEYRERLIVDGKAMKTTAANLIASDYYRGLPDEDKREMMCSTLNAARRTKRESFIEMRPRRPGRTK